jgi:hypothetical protein
VPLLAKLAALGAVLLAIWWLAVSSPEDPTEAEDFAAAGAPAAPSAPEPAQAPAAHTQPPKAEEAAGPPGEPAAADPAAPAPTPDRAKPTVNAVLPQRQGPVDELSNTFASESRGEGSAPEEARVKEAFVDPQIPKALLHSVECRRSVCRLELRWSPERDPGYVLGLTKAVGSFSSPLGVEDPGPADAQGQRPLTVYFGLSH